VPLPLLFEVGTTSSAFVLCMFHGPQYVSSAASLPGGVKLPVTIDVDAVVLSLTSKSRGTSK
jgi:hypothetical protein